MTLVALKEGVRLVGLCPQIVFGHTVVASVWPGYNTDPVSPRDIVVTSGSEGNHTNTPRPSGHYAGRALDYRTHTLWEGLEKTQREPKLLALRDTLRAALGPDFLVLVENIETETEHLHVEWLPRRIL